MLCSVLHFEDLPSLSLCGTEQALIATDLVQAIIGQLFARVSSHSEPRVRKQVEGLLMASANLSPWAIVYPLLVDLNAYEGEPSEELKRLQDCLVYYVPWKS